MKHTAMAAMAAATFLAAGAVPAMAQNYRADIGINGGGVFYTASIDEDEIGTDNEARFEAGWLSGAQITGWITPRFGIRANFAYTERPFTTEEDVGTGGDESDQLFPDVNLWAPSADLMIRLRQPAETWMGREVLPYVALGIGAHIANAPGEAQVGEETGVVQNVGNLNFLLSDEPAIMGLVALGADMRVNPNFALRAEIGDRIFETPVYALNEDFSGFRDAEDEKIGLLTHAIYGQVGLHFLMGVQTPPPVVVEPPPPPPAPEPEPEPEPEPTEEEIMVCVIDPDDPAGVRNVDAVYLIQERDTVIDGTPIGEYVADIDAPLATEADWYVGGQPLQFEFATAPQAEYLTSGTSRVINPDQLAFLGYQNGVPVYANQADVDDVWTEWSALDRTDPDEDIEDLIAGNTELRDAFDDIQFLYVPVQATGCVFQGLERQEEVRKASD